MKFIITENQKEKIALNWMDNYYFGSKSKLALLWMNKNFSPDQLEKVENPKYKYSIFYKLKKNKKVVMEQNKLNKFFYFDYDEIWSFFEDFFSMEQGDIDRLLNIWLKEVLKLEGYTPSRGTSSYVMTYKIDI